MRARDPVRITLAVLFVAACSSAPEPTVIILGNAPSAGGAPQGASTPPPITFAGTHDAAVLPPPSASGGAAPGIGGSSGGGSVGSASGVPCDVATLFASKCTACHGDPPIPSALAGLVTYDDLMAKAKEDPTKNEAELSLARMQNASSPMPPGAPPPASDVAIVQNWINAGYPKGSCGADAAPPVATPVPSVFDKAPAFVSRTGPRAHNAGRDCMSCHQNGGGEAPQFVFGGTLYDGSGNPVAGAEVRFVDANGVAASVYTATNGTFYQTGSGFAAPGHVGVRDANHSADMLTALPSPSGGACSSCHCTGSSCSVPEIHLP